MLKKKKLIILGILLAVVTLVGATAGIVFAQADNAPEIGVQAVSSVAGFSNNLTARIAKILGIDQSKLDSAIKQANSDLQAQRLDDYLARLVKAGKITQEQANQYKTWLNSNPNQTTDQQKKYQAWLDSRPNIPGLTTGPRIGIGGFGFRHFR